MEMYLTVEQTADRLQMHPVSVRRLLARGELRGVKRGRVWRIPESALGESTVHQTEAEENKVSPLARAIVMVEAQDAEYHGPRNFTGQDAASLLGEAREGQDNAILGEPGENSAFRARDESAEQQQARWTRVFAKIREMEAKYGGKKCAPGQDAVSLLHAAREARDHEILGEPFDDES